MLKRTLSLAAAAIMGMSGSGMAQQPGAQQQQDPNVGKPAPELKVSQWVTDKKVTTEQLKGAPYVLEFWATWCGPCRTTVPHLNMISQTLEPFGLRVIGLTSENAEKAKPFVEEMGMMYYVGIDEGTKSELEFSGIPFAAVVGADGKIAWAGHPMNPQFGGSLAAVVNDYIGEELKEPLNQALQAGLGGAYAELTKMKDSEKAEAAVEVITSNLAAALEHAESVEGMEKYEALAMLGSLYDGVPGADVIQKKMTALESNPEVKKAMEEREILAGLEKQVMALQEAAMKNMQDGGDQKTAAKDYIEKLLPILEKFVEDNPGHSESEQIKKMLPMMKKELERMNESPAEAESAEGDEGGAGAE